MFLHSENSLEHVVEFGMSVIAIDFQLGSNQDSLIKMGFSRWISRARMDFSRAMAVVALDLGFGSSCCWKPHRRVVQAKHNSWTMFLRFRPK